MGSDDESKVSSASSPAGERSVPPRRRGRRGGRRHSHGRRPRESAAPSPAKTSEASATIESPEAVSQPVETAEAAPLDVVTPVARHEPRVESQKKADSAIGRAVEQINFIVEELKRALDQMEEVLETVELAERQKIEDEQEIESLRRALRRLHEPREHRDREHH